MTTLVTFLAGWLALSFPVALILGALMSAGDADDLLLAGEW